MTTTSVTPAWAIESSALSRPLTPRMMVSTCLDNPRLATGRPITSTQYTTHLTWNEHNEHWTKRERFFLKLLAFSQFSSVQCYSPASTSSIVLADRQMKLATSKLSLASSSLPLSYFRPHWIQSISIYFNYFAYTKRKEQPSSHLEGNKLNKWENKQLLQMTTNTKKAMLDAITSMSSRTTMLWQHEVACASFMCFGLYSDLLL